MGYNSTFTATATGKTQADGAVTIDTTGSYAIPENAHRSPRNIALKNWQIQVVISGAAGDPAVPAAGTATISIKSPGASAFVDLATTVDLVNGPLVVSFEAVCEEIKITPADFDADKTYSAYITAS